MRRPTQQLTDLRMTPLDMMFMLGGIWGSGRRLALERQQERNTLIARGVVHRGELPIQILSRFSTVKLNLK